MVDMTIQYMDADGKPLRGSALGTRCFGQLAKGELPVETCHVHFDVFDPSEVPLDAEAVDEWCMDRWRTKATMLEVCRGREVQGNGTVAHQRRTGAVRETDGDPNLLRRARVGVRGLPRLLASIRGVRRRGVRGARSDV